MFEYLKGTLTEAAPFKVTIEIGGIGYGLFIPLNQYVKLPQIGKEVLLFISTIIREDSHKFYGFLSREERDLFELLNEVSGIGPKTALTLVGYMEISDFQLAISKADISLICKVPGIGKKTAEKLIIDLRDKLKKIDKHNNLQLDSTKSSSSNIQDAISALVRLGYHSMQAQKAVKAALAHAKDDSNLTVLITEALRNI